MAYKSITRSLLDTPIADSTINDSISTVWYLHQAPHFLSINSASTVSSNYSAKTSNLQLTLSLEPKINFA